VHSRLKLVRSAGRFLGPAQDKILQRVPLSNPDPRATYRQHDVPALQHGLMMPGEFFVHNLWTKIDSTKVHGLP
jgi:hypothetical protein